MPVTLCDAILPTGTYVLLNARGGTALDVNLGAQRLEGHHYHGRPNQQWKFINTGHGWAIMSCHTFKDGKPCYLSIKEGLWEGARVVVSSVPISWDVSLVDGALRIMWPGTKYVVELSDCGNKAPGTQVQIMELKPDERCQLWYFSRSGFEPAPAGKSAQRDNRQEALLRAVAYLESFMALSQTDAL